MSKNLKNIHKKWTIFSENVPRLYFWELHDKAGVLVILLKSDETQERVLKITFNGVLSYKVAIEAACLTRMRDNEHSGHSGPFYIVNNSAYLDSIISEGGGIFDDSELVHYSIWDSDNIIDIISGPPVDVKWIISD
ncbi:hypothetical protein [Sediminibacterium soli]|uniref:hypothetical protein n=1 Tax=Sediminibacterium soli TaxID=2698829 RepID=UPI00137A2D1C|nr:hypothetical protein [Sediminibacterium soli]NCI45798.1 hypothetical protein [Sediminibacterium soli]